MHRHITAASILVLSALAAGCGPVKYSLRSTDTSPGADATLLAEAHAAQGTTRIDLATEHLAPPDRIHAGDAAFVAWWRKNDQGAWQRIGALTYDPDKRAGVLAAASVPETSFELEVTSEKAVDPASPSPVVIFQQGVSPK